MRKTLNYIKPDLIPFQRTVSVAWCSYSTVIQLRSWLPDAVGGVCYLALDNPGQSPRIPIFCANSTLPAPYRRCGQKEYDPQVALWQFRKANKLATLAWQKTKGEFMTMVGEQEKAMLEAVAALPLDADSQMLDSLTETCHNEAVKLWSDMEARLWLMFGMGF